MGSQMMQGKFWGQRPKDWAGIQETTSKVCYEYVLDFLELNEGVKLLDIGCGSGYFCELANALGADITGIDATEPFIEEVKKRVPTAKFSVGEMEELPFDDAGFDIVTGFNSFQYAASVKNALAEARRTLKDKGKLVAMIWGNREDCEAASNLKAIGSLLPPPPPGAPGPFALTENRALENLLNEVGFSIIHQTDLACDWDYPDIETAVKGMLSSGPAARAIENSGFDKTYEIVKDSAKPYIQKDGGVIYHNKFRIVIAEK